MLYVFEGPDSVGKSTISAAFAHHLEQKSSNTVRHWSFPGREKGSLGWAVYRLHHNPREFEVSSLTPTSLQMLHIAAHIDAIETRILPALDLGEVIVLDRFWWSTLVYGLVGGANADSLHAMIEVEQKAWRGVKPTIAFVIDRTSPFSLRSDERMTDWQRLRDEYRLLIQRQSGDHRVELIKNEGSLESATNAAISAAAHAPVSSSTVAV